MQEREVIRVGGTKPIPLDIRIIAATKVNLLKAVENGTFREDLYYRLNVVPIEIKPLRTRRQDVGALAEHFVDQANRRYGLDKLLTLGAIEILEKYDWPGNVRELQNVIERSMISFDGKEITKFQIERILYPKGYGGENFKNETEAPLPLQERLDQYEKMIIEEALRKCKNASKAAEMLGMDKATLCRRMAKYQLR